MFIAVSACKESNAASIPARELTSAEKVLVGKWKARTTEAPGEEFIWEFSSTGILNVKSHALEYNGKFSLKGKTLVIELTMGTYRYIVLEQKENMIKIEARFNNVPSQTLLTKMRS